MAYLDAIEDAASIGDLADKTQHGYEIALETVIKLITEVLTKSVTQAPYQSLSLPHVSYRNALGGNIAQYSVAEIVADECSAGPAHDALMAVIAGSTCPLVAQLRQVLAQRYIDSNAADFAEWTTA